jgi:choice-of-anchor B domain-containing protein
MLALNLALLLSARVGSGQLSQHPGHLPHEEEPGPPIAEPGALSHTHCEGSRAGGFPCKNVDVLAFMPLSAIGGGGAIQGNDIWGWTDPETGKEYAIMGLTTGTSFVDISNPESPIYLGMLPSGVEPIAWRDIKVYKNHAFIVSEASGQGMQVFDLRKLRRVGAPPVTFQADANYSGQGLSTSHNIVINEETGYAYAVGTNTCAGGLHMIDIRRLTQPKFAGCFAADGYTHDAQCVVYRGADRAYSRREICFNSNEDTLTIVDVTDKGSPRQLSRTTYQGVGYTHQSWVTEDQLYLLLDDELDEREFGHKTRTYIWDIVDLDAPRLIGTYNGKKTVIDHNQYIHNGYTYQADYQGGLRILDISGIAQGRLSEVAFFDIFTDGNRARFNGAWSVYPFFKSGVVIVSGIEQGLFILEPHLPN